jgi:predicted TIM-barrel fold metal-dependent hydrolase
MDCNSLPILDCHHHLFDTRRLRYPVFTQRSAGFEALVGDYSALPRVYLPEDYGRDTSGWNVVQTMWAEFISDDPVSEASWAEDLARTTGHPDGIIALVDFLSPDLDRTLDTYATMQHVRCVRQHLGWHPTNPLFRYAARPDILSDAAWKRGLATLRRRNLICELEIFASQLPDLATLTAACPDVQFVLPLMGWPVNLTSEGRAQWKRDLAIVAACPNVAVKIFGMESIFGINWTISQIRPWILETIEIFGPGRSMFASLLPICKLAGSFQQLYGAYFEVIKDFSISEKRQLLHDTAASTYRLKERQSETE